MNLLLLFSALLSAFAGVGGVARQPRAVQVAASTAIVARAAATSPAALARPVAVLPTLASVARWSLPALPGLAPQRALFADRRRE